MQPCTKECVSKIVGRNHLIVFHGKFWKSNLDLCKALKAPYYIKFNLDIIFFLNKIVLSLIYQIKSFIILAVVRRNV